MTLAAFKPSPEQEKVIVHRGGHLQVIASAGAGKTVSRRVEKIATNGEQPL